MVKTIAPPIGLTERRRGIPLAVRRAVIERDGMVCTYCGIAVVTSLTHRDDRLHLDHVEPWAAAAADRRGPAPPGGGVEAMSVDGMTLVASALLTTVVWLIARGSLVTRRVYEDLAHERRELNRFVPTVVAAVDRCQHVDAAPVEAGGEVVAHLCQACDTQLPAEWKP